MLPPANVPPGARFDPVMPPGFPGGQPHPFTGQPHFPARGGIGRGRGGVRMPTGDPDFDELLPPGGPGYDPFM